MILQVDGAEIEGMAAVAAEVVVVMPATDLQQALLTADILQRRAGTSDLAIVVVHDLQRQGFVSCANRVFASTSGDYFAYLAQDAFPGRQWLSLGVATLKNSYGKLLGFNDGKWAGGLAAFGLIERRWASMNSDGGSLFFPEYISHYADAELTVLAMDQKVYRYNANAVLVEVDFEKDAKSVNPQDRSLFRRRSSSQFNGRLKNRNLASYIS